MRQHDRPGLKWEKLQTWRAKFKAENFGREPLLWVDKLCVNREFRHLDYTVSPIVRLDADSGNAQKTTSSRR